MSLKTRLQAFVTMYTSFSTAESVKFHIIYSSIILSILLVIFEPFSPYYGIGVFIFGITAAVLTVQLLRAREVAVIPAVFSWVRRNRLKIVIFTAAGAGIWLTLIFIPLGPSPFSGLTDDQLRLKINADYSDLKDSIFKMDNVLRGLQNIEELFETTNLKKITPEDRAKVLGLWSEFMDHMFLYDTIISEYRFFYRIAPFSRAELHDHAYLTGYTAVISRYMYAWELIALVKDNYIWEKILNEKNPEYGYPADSYTRVKEKSTHPNEVARLTVGYAHLNFLRSRMQDTFQIQEGEVFTYVDDCFLKCARNLALKSPVWAAKNSLDTFKDTTYDIWFPFQKGAAGMTGKVRLTARKKNYITKSDLDTFSTYLKPGDLIVVRRNWYLSNVGIPGFWPHVGIYLGTRESFISFFKNDPGVQEYLGGVSIEEYLETNYSKCWNDYKGDLTILESYAPGVVLSTMMESAAADYAAAMRARLSRRDLFVSLCRAFSHYGKPYDYDFDFVTDGELVCTELVYKSYGPTEDKKGIRFPLIKHAGRDLSIPQLFVKMFDKQYGTEKQQLDFVAFLDYNPEKRIVRIGSLQDFRDSWKRPKWSVLLE